MKLLMIAFAVFALFSAGCATRKQPSTVEPSVHHAKVQHVKKAHKVNHENKLHFYTK